jgi:hypothetical protein
MTRVHDRKHDDIFTDDPPAWALEVFSETQRERLTYTKLWQKSVMASDLPKSTKLAALSLSLYFSGNEEDVADPSTARLADETSMHRSTVIEQLDLLDEVGFIARARSAGRVRTRYALTVPVLLPGHTQPSDSATVGPRDGYVSETAQLSDSADQLSDSGAQLSDFDPPTVGPSDLKGLEGFTEGKRKGGATTAAPTDAPNGALEDQDQNPTAPRLDYYARGRQYADYVRDGKLTETQALGVVETIRDPEERQRFAAGMRDRLHNLSRIEVAS